MENKSKLLVQGGEATARSKQVHEGFASANNRTTVPIPWAAPLIASSKRNIHDSWPAFPFLTHQLSPLLHYAPGENALPPIIFPSRHIKMEKLKCLRGSSTHHGSSLGT
jgi:hypothetical protein